MATDGIVIQVKAVLEDYHMWCVFVLCFGRLIITLFIGRCLVLRICKKYLKDVEVLLPSLMYKDVVLHASLTIDTMSNLDMTTEMRIK